MLKESFLYTLLFIILIMYFPSQINTDSPIQTHIFYRNVTTIQSNQLLSFEASPNFTQFKTPSLQISLFHPDNLNNTNKTQISKANLSDILIYTSFSTSNPDKSDYEFSNADYNDTFITIPKHEFKGKIYFSFFSNSSQMFGFEIKDSSIIQVNTTRHYVIPIGKDYFNGEEIILRFKSKAEPFEIKIYSLENIKLEGYIEYKDNKEKLYSSFIRGLGYEINKDSLLYSMVSGEEYHIHVKLIKEKEESGLNPTLIFEYFSLNDKYQLIDDIQPPIYDMLTMNDRLCYKYIFPYNSMKNNVILTISSYSGSLILDVNPNFEENSKKSKIVKQLNVSNVIKFSPEELDFLNQRQAFFCLTAKTSSSYMIKIGMENKISENSSDNQIDNNLNTASETFLIDGFSVTGYLPIGDYTKYKIVKFENKNKSINISLKSHKGLPYLTSVFCEDINICMENLKKQDIQKGDNDKNILLSTFIDPYSQNIFIDKDKYLCTQSNINENNGLNRSCGIYAFVICNTHDDIKKIYNKSYTKKDGMYEEECEYDIYFSFDSSSVLLKENTPIKESLSYMEIDTYHFTINDDNIKSISVLLNVMSGDIKMISSGPNQTLPDDEIIKLVLNGKDLSNSKDSNGNPIDSMTIQKIEDMINRSNDIKTYTKLISQDDEFNNNPSISGRYKSLKGKYTIKILAKSFAVYSIYYKIDLFSNLPSALLLNDGLMIKDYILMNKYTSSLRPYNVYEYIVNYESISNAKDLRIILTPIKGEFDIYVYLPDQKVIYNDYYNSFEGFTWSTLTSFDDNFLIICKKDRKYIAKGIYTIVVSQIENSFHDKSSYNIVMVEEDEPILLQENTPFVSSLSNEEYSSQSFLVSFSSLSTIVSDISIDLTVYSGSIKLNIKFIKNDFYLYSSIICNSNCKYSIDKKKVEESKENTLYIEFFISSKFNTKYQLNIYSDNEKSIQLLYQGLIFEDSVMKNENNYYYGHIKKGENSRCEVQFDEERGVVLAKLLKVHKNLESELINEVNSSEENAEKMFLKVSYNINQATINIDKDITLFCNEYCVLIIKINGNIYGIYDKKDVELFTPLSFDYTITLGRDTIQLSMNNSYYGTLSKNNFKYFTLEVPKGMQNLLFSISNSKGDSSIILLNYGTELPSFEKKDFQSLSYSSNSFIQVNVLTLQNSIKAKSLPTSSASTFSDVSGVYTIAVYSMEDTSFILNISPSKEKISFLSNNFPSSCNGSPYEKCYFSYKIEEIQLKQKDKIKLSFYINFSTGTGSSKAIYIKDFQKEEYNYDKFIDKFNIKYDFSSYVKDRNYMEIILDKENHPEVFLPDDEKQILAQTNIILIQVECDASCFFHMNVAVEDYSDLLSISNDIEYFVSQPEDFNKTINYLNTKTNENDNKIENNYYLYDILIEVVEGNCIFDILNIPSSSSTQNQIKTYELSSSASGNKDVIIKITSSNIKSTSIKSKTGKSSCLYFIKVNLHSKWNKILIGDDNILSPIPRIKDQEDHSLNGFNVYFDFPDEYSYVIINIFCKSAIDCNLYTYGKFEIIDLSKTVNKKEISLGEVSEFDNEYSNNNTSNEVKSIKIKIKPYKFNVKTERLVFKMLIKYDVSLAEDVNNHIHVVAIPSLYSSNASFISLDQGQLYFSEFESQSISAKISYDIYEINDDNDDNDDNSLLESNDITIIISICLGDIHFNIFNSLEFLKNNIKEQYKGKIVEKKQNGRTILELKDVKEKLYLTVSPYSFTSLNDNTGKNSDLEHNDIRKKGYSTIGNIYASYSITYLKSKSESGKDNLKNDDETLISTNQPDFHVDFDKINNLIQFKKYPVQGQINKRKYYLYTSHRKDDYFHLDSVCYLSNSILLSHSNITRHEISPIQSNEDKSILYFFLNQSPFVNRTYDFYYINIAVLLPDGQFLIYSSTQIDLTVAKRELPIWIIPLFIGLVLFLIIIILLYRRTRRRLVLERQDINNMASINKYKTDKELEEMREKSNLENVKYSNLSELGTEI